jgi:hypothetical protein
MRFLVQALHVDIIADKGLDPLRPEDTLGLAF